MYEYERWGQVIFKVTCVYFRPTSGIWVLPPRTLRISHLTPNNMKRKANAPDHDAPNIATMPSNNEDKVPKKPRAAAKGKAKVSHNEQDWPEYFQSVSRGLTSIQDA